MTRIAVITVFAVVCALAVRQAWAQPARLPKPAEVRKLEAGLYAMGSMRIDTARREITVPAVVNDAVVLEFVANTKGGFKAYESALTADVDAISFNAAMLLIGFDPKRSRVPTVHFDRIPPSGDPLEVFVEWNAGGERRQIRVEQLLLDKRTGGTLPEGPWVYTGSTFLNDVNGERYLADMDGVLIGFVHSPAPIIENPRAGGVNAYGSLIFNTSLSLTPGTAVTLVVRALPTGSPSPR